MGKIEKKKAKIKERIEFLENEMRDNLKQKVSSTPEISLSTYLSEIRKLNEQLEKL